MRRALAVWVVGGGLIVAIWGFLGHRSARPDSVGLGVVVGCITAGWTVAAWLGWRRTQASGPVPATEYLAAVWAMAYVSLLLLTATQRSYNLVDAMIVLPPVSVLPLAARTLLRDDGDPRGRARSVAYQLHRLLGWMLTLFGTLFVLSLLFVFVAPLTLIPGVLHLAAAHRYRLSRSDPVAVHVPAATSIL